ncbi:hypothetical protein, partial [Breoghania sp.]|uniref:hypothetical protein n=1 Tax=Breoghania sp. TaxID=2065378 RepID=UPI002623761E
MFDLLLCRTAWLESYTNFDEAPTGGHSYINENEGPAHESLNFKSDNKTGYYYAYLPHNARFKDGVGNASIHLEKSGATRRDEYIDGITVVIVAPHPILNRLIVIGIYHDVRVYHKPQPRPDNPGIRYYITSANIISIPSENRYFQFPKKREGWFPRPAGFGQNALWYGLFGPAEEPKLENYRRRLLRYIASLSHSPLRTPKPKNADPLSFEERLQIISTRIERRSNVRKLIETNGYC